MSKSIHRLNFVVFADALFVPCINYIGRDACERGEITMQIHNRIMLLHEYLRNELCITSVMTKRVEIKAAVFK